MIFRCGNGLGKMRAIGLMDQQSLRFLFTAVAGLATYMGKL